MSEDSIRILPRHGSEINEWVDVKFDEKMNRVASLSGNHDTQLRFYAVEAELLTVDAALKTGQQETLTYQDIPAVLVHFNGVGNF